MPRLTPKARYEIKCSGATIAGFTRSRWPDGKWGGDSCGCTDDRCSGYHHDEHEECDCLAVLLAEYAAETFDDPRGKVLTPSA